MRVRCHSIYSERLQRTVHISVNHILRIYIYAPAEVTQEEGQHRSFYFIYFFHFYSEFLVLNLNPENGSTISLFPLSTLIRSNFAGILYTPYSASESIDFSDSHSK